MGLSINKKGNYGIDNLPDRIERIEKHGALIDSG